MKSSVHWIARAAVCENSCVIAPGAVSGLCERSFQYWLSVVTGLRLSWLWWSKDDGTSNSCFNRLLLQVVGNTIHLRYLDLGEGQVFVSVLLRKALMFLPGLIPIGRLNEIPDLFRYLSKHEKSTASTGPCCKLDEFRIHSDLFQTFVLLSHCHCRSLRLT